MNLQSFFWVIYIVIIKTHNKHTNFIMLYTLGDA